MQTNIFCVFSSKLGRSLLKWGLPIIFASLVVATFSGCHEQTAKREIPLPLVLVAEAHEQDVQLYKEYSGKTEAFKSVSIPARVQGFLEKITFTPGQYVQEGDPLFVIEQTQYQANVQKAKAGLDKAKADLEFQKADYERAIALQESRTMTAEELQDRTRNYQQAQSALEIAEAALIEAELQLSYTEINAPISGKISRNFVDIGNLVNEVITLQTPLATIENMDPIYVYFVISDSDFYQLIDRYGPLVTRASGQDDTSDDTPAQNIESDPARKPVSEWPFAAQIARRQDEAQMPENSMFYPFQGIINYVDNTINPNLGAITVRGEIPNPDYAIYPGTVCHIRVPATVLPKATIVHEKAVAVDLSNHYMLVVNKDNKVERRIVTKGPTIDREHCVISGDIKPGERYIVEGLQQARVNMPVQAKPYQTEQEETKP